MAGGVAHIFNSSSHVAELCEFEASLIYIVCLIPARATQSEILSHKQKSYGMRSSTQTCKDTCPIIVYIVSSSPKGENSVLFSLRFTFYVQGCSACLHVCVPNECLVCTEPEESTRFPRIGVTDGCKPTLGYLQSNQCS